MNTVTGFDPFAAEVEHLMVTRYEVAAVLHDPTTFSFVGAPP